MKKTAIISLIALIVGTFVFPLKAYALNWPAVAHNPPTIPMATVDNSAMNWNPVTNKLYTVTDKGIVTQMNLDGTGQDHVNLSGDFEAFTIVDPNSTKMYIGLEQPDDSILEFDWQTRNLTGRKVVLSSVMTGALNAGLEGLTWVPKRFPPVDKQNLIGPASGVFYASLQRQIVPGGDPIDDYLIYAFNVNLDTGSIINWWGIPVAAGTPNQNISDLYFSTETGVLYVLYDDSDNRLIEMNTDGTVIRDSVIRDYSNIPGITGREGVVVVANYPSNVADVYVASDSETKISWFSGYPVSYYDGDKDGVNFHVDCKDDDVTVSVDQNFYPDTDGDSLGAGNVQSLCSATAPVGFVANNNDQYPNDFDNDGVPTAQDCDDLNSSISAGQSYYRDADGDGLGSNISTTVCANAAPAGYVSNSNDLNDSDFDNDGVSTAQDCDDRDSTISTNKSYYRDADGDGKGSGNATLSCAITPPPGYVDNNSDLFENDFDNDGTLTVQDCNDHDSTVSQNKTYYQDLDGDGFGSGVSTSICSLSIPAGYVSNSNDLNDHDFDNDGVSTAQDCNDRDNTISTNKSYYRDADGDGIGTGAATSFCSASAPAGYTSNSTVDCNDNDRTVSTNQTFYRDVDGDGKGFIKEAGSFCMSTPPAGYVNNSDDLNDNDFDNDGVSTAQDCDDHNSAISTSQSYYRDADGDGVGTGVVESFCLANANLPPPAGYTSNSTVDCNDNDRTVSTNQTFYRDVDGDGKGSRTVESFCMSTPPVGYVNNNTDLFENDFDNDGIPTAEDCNDRDITILGKMAYYQDDDKDGLGFPGVSILACSKPADYVENQKDTNDNDYDNDGVETGIDCNDNNATVSVNQGYYPDPDGDKRGSGNAVLFCASVPPVGYANNNTDLFENDFDNDGVTTALDCNDLNAQIKGKTTYYQDYDRDGLGSPAVSVLACSKPVGYVSNSRDRNDRDYDNDGFETAVDCDDRNRLYHQIMVYYQDADRDGLGNPRKYLKVCVPPSNYVTNGKDTNDQKIQRATIATKKIQRSIPKK